MLESLLLLWRRFDRTTSGFPLLRVRVQREDGCGRQERQRIQNRWREGRGTRRSACHRSWTRVGTCRHARGKDPDPTGVPERLDDLWHLGDQVCQLLGTLEARFVLRAPEEVLPRVGAPWRRLGWFRSCLLLLGLYFHLLPGLLVEGIKVWADHALDEVENGVVAFRNISGGRSATILEQVIFVSTHFRQCRHRNLRFGRHRDDNLSSNFDPDLSTKRDSTKRDSTKNLFTFFTRQNHLLKFVYFFFEKSSTKNVRHCCQINFCQLMFPLPNL